MTNDLIRALRNDGVVYVTVNIMISAVGLIRSLICMQTLNFEELGLVTIFQNLAFIGSLFQLGLISGAYRLYTLEESYSEELHNTIFSFLITVLAAFSITALIFKITNPTISSALIISGVLLGVFGLYSNWLTSTFLARARLSQLNRLNLISMWIGFISILLIYPLGLFGAILSNLLQPLSLIILSLSKYSFLRPTRFSINKNLVVKSFTYGFIPFLAGILYLLNAQLERWSIAYFVNTETLGRFFLPTLCGTIFILIPNSLNNIFFPKSLKLYAEHDYTSLKRTLKTFYLLIILYDILFITVVSYSLGPLIEFAFPSHISSLPLVYLVLPGLASVSLVIPTFMMFQFSLRLKPILGGYIFSTIALLSLIGISAYMQIFSIKAVAIIDSIVNGVLLTYALIAYYFNYDKIWN